ncbi:MAG TPA: TIGR03067 domain-containing protein [Chitinophagaceae bacterium]|nr:TIGR03067 domain-containing protein [Chitinophagaceae bacterium]
MRLLIPICLAIIICSCNASNKAGTKLNSLNGSWIPVKQEMGGIPLPTTAFEKQTLVIIDSSYVFTAESIDKGVIRYNSNKMDIYGKEGVNIGKHFTAIYKLENDQLTICYNLKGDSYPEAFDSKLNPLVFLSVYKKAQSR